MEFNSFCAFVCTRARLQKWTCPACHDKNTAKSGQKPYPVVAQMLKSSCRFFSEVRGRLRVWNQLYLVHVAPNAKLYNKTSLSNRGNSEPSSDTPIRPSQEEDGESRQSNGGQQGPLSSAASALVPVGIRSMERGTRILASGLGARALLPAALCLLSPSSP